MVGFCRFLIVLAVVALILGTLARYLNLYLLPIGAPLTWLRLSGLLLLFAIALLLDQVVARLPAKG
jgi:hypothetical protein